MKDVLLKQFKVIVQDACYAKLDQGEFLSSIDKAGIDRKNVGGICFEVCRRWIARVLTDDFRIGYTVYEVFGGSGDRALGGYVQELIGNHKSHSSYDVNGNFDIENTCRGGTVDRGRKLFQFTVLRSRDDVINHMYVNGGVFLFAFTRKGGGGHAVAFEVDQAGILFFDPNFGELCLPWNNETVRAGFLNWYREFWKTYYKDEYHHGERRLVQYSRSGENPGSSGEIGNFHNMKTHARNEEHL